MAWLWLCVPSGVGESAEVGVELRGLDGDLETNARASLSILAAGDDASPGTVRRLHARAPEEIRRALQPFGFYAPAIRESLVEEGDRHRAIYDVDAGAPIRLSAVDVRVTGPGEEDPRFRELVRSFPLASGDVLDHRLYGQGKDALQVHAARKGYLDAAFDSSAILVDLARYEASIVLHYESGIRYRFGEVRLNQDVLRAEMVRGYVTFAPGEPYDMDRLLVLQADLTGGPYFTMVEIRTRREQADGDRVPIDVNMVPARPYRFEVGGGYGTDTGARGRFGAEFRRLNRRGHHAELDVTASERSLAFGTRYIIPWPYPRTEELSFLFGIGVFDPGWSYSRRLTGGAGLSRLRGSWRELVSLTYEQDDWEIADLEAKTGLLLLSASWTRTRTDDRFDPRNGSTLRAEVRGSHEAVLSDASLLQASLEARFVKGLAGPLRGCGRFLVGATTSPHFDRLPPGQRFVTGGDQSVRGYSYQSLGPRDAEGRLLGGDLMAQGSLELEWRFHRKLGLATFVDSGNAFRDDVDRFRVGAGTGLRWISPVGLVRIDGAWGMSRASRPFHIHFILGPYL